MVKISVEASGFAWSAKYTKKDNRLQDLKYKKGSIWFKSLN